MSRAKINIKAYLISISIIIFPFFNLIKDVSIFGYYDEFIAVLSMLFLLFLFLSGKLDGKLKLLYIFLILISLLGLISNLLSHLVHNPLPILLDFVGLWKTFGTFLFYSYLCRNKIISKRVINILYFPALFSLYLLFFTSIIGQVVDIGVTGENVGPFKQFCFFWQNGIGTGWLLFSSILIISIKKIKTVEFIFYLIIASIPAILTFSSLVFCWIFVELALMYIVRERTIFKIKYFVILGIGVLYFAYADVEKYFLQEAPRLVLIQYGIIVANMYFPFGSGFATYGTEMARRYYSPLYVQFGWSDSWAFGEDSVYLNDVFIGGIIGEFGWIGFVFYLCCIYILFKYVNVKALKKNIRITSLSTVVTMAVVMIGSASVKSMMGEFCFATLGITTSSIFLTCKKMKKNEIYS